MDAEFSDLFLQDCPTALGFDSASDAGYYSACDGLSPASSSAAESSSCLSPTWFPSSGACGWASPLSPLWSSSPGQEEPESETDLQSNSVQLQAPALPQNQEQTGGFQEPPAQTCFTIQPIQLRVPAPPSLHQQRAAFPLQEQTQTQTQTPQRQQDGKRSRGRTRQPGKKRHNASEREKLRMRDLTKALHHLRSYLPASVAPAGQTLTKIQTLRYTIRYIAHLSAQVEASHGDTGVRMEQYHSQAQTPSQVQGFLQGHSPAQHLHCPQQQTLDPWSQHRLQYGIHSEPNTPCQQNQTLIANCLTSAGEPHMTIYQQQNLVPVSHGFCYSHDQL